MLHNESHLLFHFLKWNYLMNWMHEDENWLLIHLFRVLKCLIISLQYTIVRQTEPFVQLVQCSAVVFRCRNWVPGHWELILWEAGCGLDSASKLYPTAESHSEMDKELLSQCHLCPLLSLCMRKKDKSRVLRQADKGLRQSSHPQRLLLLTLYHLPSPSWVHY